MVIDTRTNEPELMQCQDVAGSKKLDGSYHKQNVALSRNGSHSHENANVCSAEVLEAPHFR